MAQAQKKLLIVCSIVGLLLTSALGSAIVVSAKSEVTTQAFANLVHTPSGMVQLQWSPTTKVLSSKITLTGLAPNSTHPAHIHLGVCTSIEPIAYMLNNVVADASGNGVSLTTISGVTKGIPASGWHINVHNGPGLSPATQFIPIACGNVQNPHAALGQEQTVTTALGSTNAANQAASGKTELSLVGSTLTVVVTIHGLIPGSNHAAHIHNGSCQNQIPGKILYMLNNIIGDTNGNAVVKTVLTNVNLTTIPTSGWYINVHRTINLGTQTGLDAIACGNVQA